MPFRHRNALRSRGQALPCLLNQLKPLLDRKPEDVLEYRTMAHHSRCPGCNEQGALVARESDPWLPVVVEVGDALSTAERHGVKKATVSEMKWPVTAFHEVQAEAATTSRPIHGETATINEGQMKHSHDRRQDVPPQKSHRAGAHRSVLSAVASLLWSALGACSGAEPGPAAPPPPPVPVVTLVEVTPTSRTLDITDTLMMQAVVKDQNGAIMTQKAVTWASSAPAVAVVSSSGLVTAVARGSAVIDASVDGKSGTAAITVRPPVVTTVSVTPVSATMDVADTLRVAVIVKDQRGVAMTDKTAVWTTSAATVASVNSAGLVTALAGGAATIAATVDGKAASTAITVRAPVAAVVVTPDTGTVEVGKTVTLRATTRDAQGVELPGRVIEWKSLDSGLASVSSGGVVTAMQFGRARIVASSGGRADTASLRIPTPASVTTLDGSKARTATVGAAGGRIETTDAGGTRYRFDVPAGALLSPVAITMTPIRTIAGYPLSGGMIGGVELAPSGLTFASPATLSVESTRQAAAGQRLAGISYVSSGGIPLPELAARTGSTITLPIRHFSQYTVGFGTVADLELLLASYPPNLGEDASFIAAVLIATPNPVDVERELVRTFDTIVLPALQNATTDLQLAAALGEFRTWRDITVLVEAVMNTPNALVNLPSLVARRSTWKTAFAPQLRAALDGNNVQCGTPANGATRSLFLDNIYWWTHQGFQELGQAATPILFVSGLCARVGPPQITLANPVQASVQHSLDAQFGLVFQGDVANTPTHMSVSAAVQGGTLDRLGGLTAGNPVGFYTTILTPASGNGTTQVQLNSCYSSPFIVATPALQSLLCGSQPVTRTRIGSSPLTIVSTGLPTGQVGAPYSATLQASGGAPPILWSVVGGSLPGGLVLNNGTGGISGTPTQAPGRTFTVRARSGIETVDATFTLSISGPPFEGIYQGTATGGSCASQPAGRCPVASIWLSHEFANDYCFRHQLAVIVPTPNVPSACTGTSVIARFTGNTFVVQDRGTGGTVHGNGTVSGNTLTVNVFGFQFTTQRLP